jgi:hypothetical protein
MRTGLRAVHVVLAIVVQGGLRASHLISQPSPPMQADSKSSSMPSAWTYVQYRQVLDRRMIEVQDDAFFLWAGKVADWLPLMASAVLQGQLSNGARSKFALPI